MVPSATATMNMSKKLSFIPVFLFLTIKIGARNKHTIPAGRIIQKKIKQRVLNFSTWREGKERA